MSNWLYQQRKNPCHPNPYALTLPKGFFEFVNDYLGADFQEMRLVYKKGVLEFYVEEDSWKATIARAKKVFDDDPNVAEELESTFNEKAEEFLTLSKEIHGLDVDELSNEDLFKWHMKYVKSYEEAYPYGEPLAFLLKSAFTDELKTMLQKSGVGKDNLEDVLQKLITPRRRSFVNQEEYELAQIAQEADISGDGTLLNDTKKRLKEHTQKYRWIPYDYGVTTWGYADFKGRMLEMKREENLNKKINELANYPQRIRNRQEGLYDEYDISQDQQRYFAGIRTLTHLNDTKKEVFTKSHLLLRPLQDEMADRLDLSWDLMSFLTFDELEQSLQKGELVVGELEDRYDFSVLVVQHEKEPEFICGGEAKELVKKIEGDTSSAQDTDIIEGNAASSGVYSGPVKVLSSAKEVDRIEKGDVLVTVMTSPDYVTAMKRAGAIVTNEGGITSHAAIVSRELEIPCVIGTENATGLLRDGDEVEVNADKGIIRIINTE